MQRSSAEIKFTRFTLDISISFHFMLERDEGGKVYIGAGIGYTRKAELERSHFSGEVVSYKLACGICRLKRLK